MMENNNLEVVEVDLGTVEVLLPDEEVEIIDNPEPESDDNALAMAVGAAIGAAAVLAVIGVNKVVKKHIAPKLSEVKANLAEKMASRKQFEDNDL